MGTSVRRRGRLRSHLRALHQAEQLAGTLAQVGAAADLEGALVALVNGALTLLEGAHGIARLFDLSVPSGGEGGVTVYVEAHAGGQLDVRWNPPGHLQPGNFGARLRDGGPPALVEDFWALDPQQYPAYETMRRQSLRASVNVPIDAGGRRIGSLHVDHGQAGFFGPADLAAAAALAAQAGAAIERARVEAARVEVQRLLEAQAGELAARHAEAGALRELDRLKGEFIQSISHELRTPLTVVHGYAQQLYTKGATLDGLSVQRMAGRLLEGSTRLTRLVADLLDFTQIVAGDVGARAEVLDLAVLLRELVEDLRQRPGGERLVCEVRARPVAWADRAKTRQSIANLVDNALKYAPEGEIVARAMNAVGMVRVEVEDRGPGVSEREQARVWESFYRGEAVAGLNTVPGSGVGLTVAKALVEAQNGRVGMTTTSIGGCCFWLELPEATCEHARG